MPTLQTKEQPFIAIIPRLDSPLQGALASE